MEIEHKQGRRRWRKKGFLFTLVTIFALMVFIFSLTFQSNIKIKNRMHAIESRIRTMDSFIEDFKRDFERGLYISSFRALLSIENRIVADSVFISDTKALFHEAVANGTLDGVPSPLMSGAKITDWITKIKEEAEKINIILNISVISDPSLGQDDPWYIRVSMNISYVVEDMGGIAIWNTSGEIVAQIPVQGLEDPFYIVYGEGRLTRLINESPYLNNFTWKVEEPHGMSHICLTTLITLSISTTLMPLAFCRGLRERLMAVQRAAALKACSTSKISQMQGFLLMKAQALLTIIIGQAMAMATSASMKPLTGSGLITLILPYTMLQK